VKGNMNKRQISRLNAARSVQVVLERWKDSLPEAAQEAHQELTELVDSIAQQGRQQVVRHGLSADKAQALNNLADAAVALAGTLLSYGTASGDDRLVASSRYSRTGCIAS
jgi:hypothetical protein